jgi:hypothetical protein
MKYLNFFGFILAGIVFGIILIVVSEFSSFSHLNLVPFGGKSWALWVYPVVLFLGVFISSFLFKIKNKLIILLSTAIIVFLLFLFVFNGNLFVNPIPFGK